MESKILLVEGEGDKNFFEVLFKKIRLKVKVQTTVPEDHGAEKNGKSKIVSLLETLIDSLRDGQITNMAVVVDADYKQDGGGYQQTIDRIKKKIKPKGYDSGHKIVGSGLSFPHNDGLSNFGLWVMPDNQSDGMFEDWIKKIVKKEELPLFEHAVRTVNDLQEKKFKPIHSSKAEIASWMAWQKIPGEALCVAIKDDAKEELIDLQAESAVQLITWLRHIYCAEIAGEVASYSTPSDLYIK